MPLANTADRYFPQVLSIVRIMTALLLLQHPLSKFFAFPLAMKAPAMFSLIWFAGAIELVFGVLLLIGLFSRFAAFILSGELAFAYFIGHAPQGFFPLTNRGEAAVLFCFLFLMLAFTGGGAWSVDAMRGRDVISGRARAARV
ncbi:MAG: DoxX family protein [Xanthobacteraceae bacterium]|nr:DoxX family protein [Xanthobacteraceae bacterium]